MGIKTWICWNAISVQSVSLEKMVLVENCVFIPMRNLVPKGVSKFLEIRAAQI